MATVLGYKTKWQYATDTADYATAATWVDVGQVVAIKPAEREASDIKTSHMQSTSQTHTYRAGWIESGEAEITIQFLKAITLTLEAFIGTEKAYRILYNDAASSTDFSGEKFNGYIKKISKSVDMEGLVEATFTVKVTGVSVFDGDTTT